MLTVQFSIIPIYMTPTQTALERAKKIKVILTDVDGILTDGKVNFYVAPDGRIEEIKSFHTQDGIAAMLCRSAGLICGIITGRRHETTVSRAGSLGFKYMYQGFLTKSLALKDVLQKENITAEEVAYIGDDITDLPLLKEVGFAATVPGALDVVKAHCHYVTKRVGGDGAYREIIDFILKAQGKLDELVHDPARWTQSPKPEMEIVTSQEGIK